MSNESSNTTETTTGLKQAKVLSEALPYLRRFAGETVVVKYGGHAMSNINLAGLFARDMVLLRQIGLNPVIVHGGGPQIGDMLDKLKIKSKFVDGLRITTEEAIDIVEMVLSGSINKKIVSSINNAGGYAVGLSGKDGNLIQAEKLTRIKQDFNSNTEKCCDLGLVGTPKEINPYILDAFEKGDITPVIAPIGVGQSGETLNINADTVAGTIAAAVKATRLYMLTDVAGVLDNNGQIIPQISISEASQLIKDGTIQSGMIPKIENCVRAVKAGVEAATIIDGRTPHAILVELFTKGGTGTQITRD